MFDATKVGNPQNQQYRLKVVLMLKELTNNNK